MTALDPCNHCGLGPGAHMSDCPVLAQTVTFPIEMPEGHQRAVRQLVADSNRAAHRAADAMERIATVLERMASHSIGGDL